MSAGCKERTHPVQLLVHTKAIRRYRLKRQERRAGRVDNGVMPHGCCTIPTGRLHLTLGTCPVERFKARPRGLRTLSSVSLFPTPTGRRAQWWSALDPLPNPSTTPKGAFVYHEVMPDAHRFEGVKDLSTGRQSYYRKISDSEDSRKGMYNKLIHSRTALPTESLAISKGHKRKYGDERLRKNGFRPAMYELHKTTGFSGYGSKLSYLATLVRGGSV